MSVSNAEIFLGIDPGYADMGFGLIDKQRGRCLAYGSIQTAATEQSAARLKTLYDGLVDLIERYKPTRAAVEKLYFAKNTKTALRVAEARGVILLCLEHSGIPYIELDPVQVKVAVCGHGRASKVEMQKMVRLLLKLKTVPKPDDAADALALAVALKNYRVF